MFSAVISSAVLRNLVTFKTVYSESSSQLLSVLHTHVPFQNSFLPFPFSILNLRFSMPITFRSDQLKKSTFIHSRHSCLSKYNPSRAAQGFPDKGLAINKKVTLCLSIFSGQCLINTVYIQISVSILIGQSEFS